MNVDECIEAFETLGDEIFGHPRWRHIRQIKLPFLWWPRSKYNKDKFERVIQGFVDKYEPRRRGDPAGSDHLPVRDRCKTGVVGVIEDKEGARPYLFRSYNHIYPGTSTVLNPGPATNVLIAKVARATTAAPTYFQHADLRGEKFVDGGLGNNNPSWIAYFEVSNLHKLHRRTWRAAHQLVGQTPASPQEQQVNAVGALVSIGTGKTRPARLVGPAGISRYVGYARLTRKMATNSEEIHRRMVSVIEDNGAHYYRLNVQTGLDGIKLDEWKTSRDAEGNTVNVTLRNIEAQTRAYLQSPGVMDDIRACARTLIQLRNAANPPMNTL
ncbi:hypothetical protein FGG08_006539 [Glutinoglossum americanum]|uniref:PNPLA domain-containing protein n=1 Tax=Glutinoglossum americanum TaxID=1670608 RepID=A0A9P8L1T5_9PEZI|nr:hypothetical protein FGG08_006539 [Glutinoglossum americanum]